MEYSMKNGTFKWKVSEKKAFRPDASTKVIITFEILTPFKGALIKL